MKQRYLEVTFRNGKPLAAYLYLPRSPRGKVKRTIEAGHGLLIDLDAAGEPLGVEITDPSLASYRDVNKALLQYGVEGMKRSEWAPLAA